ncbi:OX-2 membrane glycoprotein-like isoform X2 [Betta splendens]|uniref:OX-2 membrane glycoprotein-like isoform X2 n=1 Tax=Betta splendens TaxID=158456 RepID=A0A9W2XMM4_BETSP|nr:OX-2 membrane glycoprotein-like isoform X2 [Betta splendens]
MQFFIYRLLFVSVVFPKGVRSQVQTHQTVMGALGEEAHFSCLLTESKDVLQVTWQKILPDVDKNVATYNKFGQRVDPDFKNKVKFKVTELQNSSMVISSVTEQDEGCYLCLFITYPEGAFKGRTCLQVCELHEPILHVRGSNSSEESLVSCSVTARPAPTVTLTVTQQHLYFSHYSTVTVTNANNTLTVTKTAVLSGLHGDGTQVGCAVRVPSGPQKEVFMNITEVKPKSADGFDEEDENSNKRRRWILIVVVGLIGLSFFIVLCLRFKRFFFYSSFHHVFSPVTKKNLQSTTEDTKNEDTINRAPSKEDTNLSKVQEELCTPSITQKAEVSKRTPPLKKRKKV